MRTTCRTLNFSQLSLKIAFEIFQFSQFSVEGFHFSGKFSLFLLNRIHALVVLCFEVVKLLLQLLRDLFDIFNINRHRISPD
ncbi:hypothetical protein BW76_06570 [Escherichia coli O28ac:NM str. 02-3404]|nr:hypothetical protein BW76_06570 [Escherichia coli O28ac:NM str. 02-3404]